MEGPSLPEECRTVCVTAALEGMARHFFHPVTHVVRDALTACGHDHHGAESYLMSQANEEVLKRTAHLVGNPIRLTRTELAWLRSGDLDRLSKVVKSVSRRVGPAADDQVVIFAITLSTQLGQSARERLVAEAFERCPTCRGIGRRRGPAVVLTSPEGEHIVVPVGHGWTIAVDLDYSGS
jgi:hypothetical protein